MKDVVFFPHFGMSGGAGLYIKQVVESLKGSNVKIYFAGDYSTDYYGLYDEYIKCQNGLVFPNYKGVRGLVVLFFLFKTIFTLPFFIFGLRKVNPTGKIFVLTSSVQVLNSFFIKFFFRPEKIVLLVQENWVFGNFLGFISKFFFRRCDLVVSITPSWQETAKANGIDSIVFPNLFSRTEFLKVDVCSDKVYDYDFVYLGGGSSIKGFNEFCDFVRVSSELRWFSVAALGHFSSDQLNLLKEVVSSSSYKPALFFFGFVTNPSEYIYRSKLLLLPIASPHFCRPAIEAGLLHTPFIIRQHEDIDDFAKPGFNCVVYKDVDEMIKKSFQIIDRPSDRCLLGENNFDLSSGYLETDSVKNYFFKSFFS